MFDSKEIIEDQIVIGDPSVFAIGYAFLGDDRCTELSMWVHGTNLLGFTKEGGRYTTRWPYLEDLVAWLNNFALSMADDPFPIDVDGEYAAEKDANARDHAPELDDGSSDEEMEAFDAYFDHFSDWTWDHTWHSESGGAILSHMFFEYKDGMVELSWDNRGGTFGYEFDCEFGGTRVDAETFKAVVLEFVDAYERHWGIKVDDDSTWLRGSRAQEEGLTA